MITDEQKEELLKESMSGLNEEILQTALFYSGQSFLLLKNIEDSPKIMKILEDAIAKGVEIGMLETLKNVAKIFLKASV